MSDHDDARSLRAMNDRRLPAASMALRGSLATAFAVAASAVSLVVFSRPAASDDDREARDPRPVLMVQAGRED
jgi:hypothetical protein